MSERKISYLNRTFEDYRDALKNLTKTYYPSMGEEFDDASIGSWMVDLVASVADNLSYHIDATYGETVMDSARQKGSVYALARSNGYKIPGPKGAMAEVEFSCDLPVAGNNQSTEGDMGFPDWAFAPVIKTGTRLKSNSGQYFEVVNDVNFAEQFDVNGYSNRTIQPYTNSNGVITKYIIKKTETVIAGESRVYKVAITPSMIKPFMEILIPETNVMNVESIILKEGSFKSDPIINEFMMNAEHKNAIQNVNPNMYRFFEVDSLSNHYRWSDINNNGNAVYVDYYYKDNNNGNAVYVDYYHKDNKDNKYQPFMRVYKGEWKPITQKYITEYTDKGYMKVVFGSGSLVGQEINSGMTEASKHIMSKMVNNDFLGKLPAPGYTMFIRYRVGGGASSNVGKNMIKTISYLNVEYNTCPNGAPEETLAGQIKNTIRVTNTTPSVSGKDMPSTREVKELIKYNNSAQERCVTIKDYIDRVYKMPPRYGCPYRVTGVEENNKVMLYILGINESKKLTATLPSQLILNMMNYLSYYRQINDYVEIKGGRIINITVEVDLFVDKNYNATDVVKDVISIITDYMDISKHQLGEDIYVSDLEKEIGKIDGVLNLIETRVYNIFGSETVDGTSYTYSPTQTSQATYPDNQTEGDGTGGGRRRINLDESDYLLNSEVDEMFEIKYPERDIKLKVKKR